MIFKIDRQQRNYNYLEIIREYNRAMDIYPADVVFEKKDFYKFTQNLKGFDSADEIFEAMLPEDSDITNPNELELFYEANNNEYCFAKSRKIKLTASKEEAAVLYSMLKSGDLDLYFDKKELLENNLCEYFENLGAAPVDINDYIIVKGKSALSDKTEDIKENFSQLQSAIKHNRFVRFDYYKSENGESICVLPKGIIYSQLDGRFRLKALCFDGLTRTFYLSYIKNPEIIKEKPFEDKETEESSRELVFEFDNVKGLNERVCARFSDYKKQVFFNQKNNTVTYKVHYSDNPHERARIISRLLSLADNLRISTEEVHEVKERAKKALELYA